MKLLTKAFTLTSLALATLTTAYAAQDNYNLTLGKPTFIGTLVTDTKTTETQAQTPATADANATKYLQQYAAEMSAQVKQALGLSEEEFKVLANELAKIANEGKGSVEAPTDGGAELRKYLSERAETVYRQQLEILRTENIAKGKVALEEFAKKPGAVTDPSGVVYIIENEGKGNQVKDTDFVKVLYKGSFDGKVFDQAMDKAKPAEFSLENLIPGFRIAATKLKVGGKLTALIPYNLAYGELGNQAIPPGATLQFEIEILDAKPATAAPKK